MKQFLYSLVLLAGLVSATACSKDDDDTAAAPAPLTVSGTLSGAQEVPAVTSSGTGTVSGTYNKTTKELKYTVTFSGITPTVGHFHIGAPGTTGPVTLPFGFNNSTNNGFVSPITGTVTLSNEQAAALLENKLYANLHSAAAPSGEIRADVTAK
ncbi:CHRD domain-containing protein [Hymenobacter chitinivorans]|uniref:CHRD domain-containing protein n=1 Tax=Hymenobacter chitinivorans DSM 11115 TaxID=1121954 RepID=A0A2M9BLT7_9BACT|nr:CHRD domain-containing protein [Hymenobacter chitinivorans]PJJ58890.1 CHRD domain-containing protein [Hymenobacter chitinivorans DSM 11115]